jgi:hypothetical protein
MKKNKIVSAIIAFSLVLSVGVFSGCNSILPKEDFQKVLVKTAEDLAKTCPQTIDAETRLDNVSALPNELRYQYTLVNYKVENMNADTFKLLMQPTLFNLAKTNPDLKIFRDNKTTLTWVYNDKEGKFITQISATEKEYKSK